MAHIIIAYQLHYIDEEQKRIYLDSTEKYFDSLENQDSKDYIEYLIKKGMNIDVSPITILEEGDLNVTELYKADALAKLTDEERQLLGV